MSLHLAIVVSDAHAPGARLTDLASDRERVLKPLVEHLESRPSLRMALHLSQIFLDHIREAEPELVPRLQALTKKKRITFLCSLSAGALPWLGFERDAVAQLKQHRGNLERLFGAPVRGAWPVGLAWNPVWTRLLGRAGLRYSLCDTRTLVTGGCASPVRSWVKVRSENHRASVLPFDFELVHRIPAASPGEVLRELREEAERGVESRVLVLPFARLARWGADEKGRYLTSLMDGIGKQGGWMRLVLPQLLLERTGCAGVVHPPAATPLHVGVGLLRDVPGRRLLDTADALTGRRDIVLAAQVPGLTGPPFDTGFDAWPEAGLLVDRSARVGSALALLRRRAAREKALQPVVAKATRCLHQGSSSAPLWDGDGGIVGEPSARHSAWRALVNAEDHIWSVGPGVPQVEQPGDGGPIDVRTSNLVVAVDPNGGAIVELSLRGVGNLVNILTPLPRPWGDRFSDPSLPCLVSDEEPNTDLEVPTEEPTDAPTSPPESLLEPDSGSLEPVESLTHLGPLESGPRHKVPWAPIQAEVLGLAEFHRPFALFQDLILPPDFRLEALARGMAGELGDFADRVWRVERSGVEGDDVEILLAREGTIERPGSPPGMVQITKRMRFCGEDRTIRVQWTMVNRSRDPVRARFGVVVPLNIDGLLSPERTLHVPGRLPKSQDAMGTAEGVADFALRFADIGVLVRARPEHPVRVDHFPLIAPVRRREGHCAVFQGAVAVLSWPLELWGEETRAASMVLEIHQR